MNSLAIGPTVNRKGLKEISTVNPIQVLHTDALTGLKSVASASAQVCLTSPQQPEFFKHYVPGIAHKSEMGVPFRFHPESTQAVRRLCE